MSDVLVLLSGGLDSVLLCTMAAHRLSLAVFFDYDQPAAAFERASAIGWAKHFGVELVIRDLEFEGLGPMNEPLSGGPRVVPGRNLLMVATALNIAEARGLHEVWYGANKDDWADYPDCRPSFVQGVNDALFALPTAPGWSNPMDLHPRVIVRAPLQWMEGHEIASRLAESGVDFDDLWSCYEPVDGKPCDVCASCVRRSNAMVSILAPASWDMVDGVYRTACCGRTGREFEVNGHGSPKCPEAP